MTDNNIDYFDFVKSENKNSIFSNPNIKQLISVIVGNEKMENPQNTDDKEKQITKTYMRMLFSLVIVHLCRGETLGVARQKSLATMNNYVKSKENDTIGKYLTKAKERFNPEFAKINMNDKDGAKRKLETNQPQDLEKAFATEFKNSMESLNKMSGQKTLEKTMGKPVAEQTKKQENFKAATQNTQQLIQNIILQQRLYQRAA